MKEIRAENYKCNISDLELPFILYRLGEYYQAYLIYKELAFLTWKNKKYILYFICMHNIYSIRYNFLFINLKPSKSNILLMYASFLISKI